MDYQKYASLAVNLNRLNLGPLDISSVFNSIADFNYYRCKKKVSDSEKEKVSTYWRSLVNVYPYEGQIVSVIDENNNVFTCKLFYNPDKDIYDYITFASTNSVEELNKRMFVCLTQKEYNDLLLSPDGINKETPYLIIDDEEVI